MNRQDCQVLIDAYVDWLRNGLTVESLDTACELTTPFLDRHNDHLQIYAVREGAKVVLSDDGYILADLRTSGLDIATPKRRAIMEAALNGYGVRLDGNRLVVEASSRNLGQRLHSLIQAMLTINDMFVMAQPRVATFFFEDVRAYLDEYAVRYSPRVKMAGKSGFDHAIDFLIPKSPQRPERLIQAINAPNKNTIGTYLFALGDTRDLRANGSEAYAFLNDQGREVGGDVLEALEVYGVIAALWSQRQKFANALSQ